MGTGNRDEVGAAAGAAKRRARRRETTAMETTTQERSNDQSASSADEQRRLREEIEQRAYALWLAGGCGHGKDVGDWLQADREVLEDRAATSASLGEGEGVKGSVATARRLAGPPAARLLPERGGIG